MPPPHCFARFGGHDQGGLMMNHILAVVLMVIASVYTAMAADTASAPTPTAQKAVLITAASTGSGGILTGPHSGAYSMSKHAVEAFADVLAAEMAPRGVQVSVVEPGNYNSEISRSAATRMGATGFGDRSRYKEPDEVAAVVLQALSE